MVKKINQDNLRNLIVTGIRDNGFDDFFDEETIKSIQERMMNILKFEKNKKEVSEIIPESELNTFRRNPNGFPYDSSSDEIKNSVVTNTFSNNGNDLTGVGKEPGSESTETSFQPITPEIGTPIQNTEDNSFLNKIEPSKFIVFDWNEVASVSGENLSNKPLRKFENPDLKKTIHNEWVESGVTKAEIYMAKFEKIGEVMFDYKQGTSVFVESKDIDSFQQKNKEYHNPYMKDSLPQVDKISTETDLKKSIESSLDLEKVAYDVIKDIFKEKMNVNEMVVKKDELLDSNKFELTRIDENIKKRMLGELSENITHLFTTSEVTGYSYNGKKYFSTPDFEKIGFIFKQK